MALLIRVNCTNTTKDIFRFRTILPFFNIYNNLPYRGTQCNIFQKIKRASVGIEKGEVLCAI